MRGRVAIPAPTFPSRDLVGHYEVLLDPVDGRGLVPPPAFVVGQGFPFVALLNGGVVVEGGGRTLALGGHPVHQGRGHAGQPLEGGGLRGDVSHLPGGPGRLGLGDPLVIVERVQEVTQRVRRGEPPAEEAAEPAVRLEDRDVVEAVPPGREQEDERLDLLRLGVAALALADMDVLGDRLVQAEGAHRLEDEGEPGAAGQPGRGRDRLHRVREQALAHRGRARSRGGVRWRRARFTAVSSLTIVQSSS